jgi:hypothetical protein
MNVTQCDARMREGTRIQDHESHRVLPYGMDSPDEFVFRVALQANELVTGRPGTRLEPRFDLM